MPLVETDGPRPFARTAVLASAAAFAVLAVVVWHATTPMSWERPILDTFRHHPLPLRDYWIAMFEPVPFALIATALACSAAGRGQGRLALAGLVGCLGAVVLAEVVFKPIVHRVRVHTTGGVGPHIVHFSRPMFPSAHVTAAAALATFAWFVFGRHRRLAPVLIAIPLVVGHSVISRQMHYPADVAAGLLLGPTFVYCAVTAARATADRAATTGREPDATDEEPPAASRAELLVDRSARR